MGLFAICGMAVSFTFSRALFNVFALLLLLSWLVAGRYAARVGAVVQMPMVVAAVLLYAWMALGLLYSEAPLELARSQVSTHHKLLLIPLVAGFLHTTGNLKKFWLSVLFGLVLLQTAYLGDLWVDIPFSRSAKEGGPGVFNNYIVEGLSLATFCLLAVCASLGFWNERRRLALTCIVLAALAFFSVVFLNPGRGAQLALVAGLLVLVFFVLPSKLRWSGLLACAVALSLLAWQSDVLKERFKTAVAEAQSADAQAPTSVGLRLNAWKVGVSLWLESPLIGHGPGSYEHLMHTQKSSAMGGCQIVAVCQQPHSQYVLLLVEQGVVGLLLFLGMLGALVWPAFKNPHISARFSASFACLFAVHSAFDSGLKMGTQMFIFVVVGTALAASTRLYRPAPGVNNEAAGSHS